jgi:hypothetical protein
VLKILHILSLFVFILNPEVSVASRPDKYCSLLPSNLLSKIVHHGRQLDIYSPLVRPFQLYARNEISARVTFDALRALNYLFQSVDGQWFEDPRDIEWNNMNQTGISGVVHAILDQLELGPHQSNRKKHALIEGTLVDDVVIVTHQIQPLAILTTRALENTELSNAPRLFLVKPHYPVFVPKLVEHATLIRLSGSGEIRGVTPRANTFHLMGGNCVNCLSTTVMSLLAGFRGDADRSELRLILHSSVVWNIETGLPEHTLLSQASEYGISHELDVGTIEQNLFSGTHFLSEAVLNTLDFKSAKIIETPFGKSYRHKFICRESGKVILIDILLQ